MTGIRGLKALSLFIALPITGFLLGDTILKTPSVADCTFHSDPDRFTAPERRVRRALNDRVVALTRGLKRDAVLDYIKTNKPTYPQFEGWVKKNATKLDKGSVEKLNAAIRGYIHDDETRKSILGANGLPDDTSAPKDAVNLNNLDDWKEFHQAVLQA